MIVRQVPCRRVTEGPKHHFFGYYEKCPWDETSRYMLTLAVDVVGRMPLPGESAVIGMMELATGRFIRLAETRAWNLQQGCMLQWHPGVPGRKVIYNDCQDGRCFAVVLDVFSGEKECLPLPVYTVDRRGRFALTVSFARLHRWRPVTGYAGITDLTAETLCPDNDGIFRLDLATGESRLLLSLAELAHVNRLPTMDGKAHWIEHLVLSPDDRRVAFIHRWQHKQKYLHRLFSLAPDGGKPFFFSGYTVVSHMDWKSTAELLVWADRAEAGQHFFLLRDRSDDYSLFAADRLDQDGHCSFSPDGRWLLTDTKPDSKDSKRRVILYRLADGACFLVGEFFSPRELTKNVRCDLHPRWSRDGRNVCIDSAHEGSRQVYILDVAGVVDSPADGGYIRSARIPKRGGVGQ